MNEDSEELFFIDTNILVYSLNKRNLSKHMVAEEFLNKCWKRKTKYALSTQNLAEFFVVMTKKASPPIPDEDVEGIIQDILEFSNWKVVSYNPKTLSRAIFLHKKTKKHFWDCLIAATMLENGISHIFTENVNDFVGIEGIKVINPFL